MTKSTVNPDLYSGIVLAPFGAVGFQVADKRVSGISFLPGYTKEKKPSDAFSSEVFRQLEYYLIHPEFDLNFPVLDSGTEYQQKVRRDMKKIPAGMTKTYGELAKQIGSAARAVGGVCAKNPLVLYYPCHRVVASGSIGGFSGETDADSAFLKIKHWLLKHEGVLRYQL